MKTAVLALVAVSAAAQTQSLSPTAEFNLNANAKPGHILRSFLIATPDGLTFLAIGDKQVSLTSASLDGRILHSQPDLAAVNQQIFQAVPRPDGSIWVAYGGPYTLAGEFGLPMRPATPNNEFVLFSRAGQQLKSLRMLVPNWRSESLIAAGVDDDEVVLRSATHAGSLSAQEQMLHFGSVGADGQLHERAQVKLQPVVSGAIAVLRSDGVLLLISKNTGNIVVVDPNTKCGSVIRLAHPHPVRAVALDSNSLYQRVSNDTILKTDVAGEIVSTIHLQLGRGFQPTLLSVAGSLLYLADNSGRTERFTVPIIEVEQPPVNSPR